jgi:hypothetical protein
MLLPTRPGGLQKVVFMHKVPESAIPGSWEPSSDFRSDVREGCREASTRGEKEVSGM